MPRNLNSLRHGATRGGKRNRTHSIWHNMLSRCRDPKNKRWARYGGRGITVCESWLKFENFRDDMGPPFHGESIDRIDNDGPYCVNNCIWADAKQQARNKSSNRLLAFNNKTQSLAAWAEELKIPYFTLHARLRRGWSVEKTLTETVKQNVR